MNFFKKLFKGKKKKTGEPEKILRIKGPWTDWEGKELSKIFITREDFKDIREQRDIPLEEYDEMIECLGVWNVGISPNGEDLRSFVFMSTINKDMEFRDGKPIGGNRNKKKYPRIIVITESFLKGILCKYKE